MANPTDYRLQEGCINRLIDDVASSYSPSDPFGVIVWNYASLIGIITSNCFTLLCLLYFWAIRCGDADAFHIYIPMDTNAYIGRSIHTQLIHARDPETPPTLSG
ncbi:hypothetical protein P168DRAFT_288996 [Aspergillus campestris IBT 28561]|uniref:Uncharacterized protein n=1 Tax=Aspergillus campestris (strain IBT 28561) TaxID=1392248 RepID=A0A2I1D6N6_ASPC2|nr:uncharacterized protein P168DRAFT_288996 [Aspergillus campestris IBT 28561]PKY05535.1 hypothetical protein P168DRAFT_288996 [Aspergillus campestris IBT 28561]